MDVNIMELIPSAAVASSSPKSPAKNGCNASASRSHTPHSQTSRTSSTSELERDCDYLSINERTNGGGGGGAAKASGVGCDVGAGGDTGHNDDIDKNGVSSSSSPKSATGGPPPPHSLTASATVALSASSGTVASEKSSNSSCAAAPATSTSTSTIGSNGHNGTIKKRTSSSRTATTPAVRARRIRFYRNGDRFYAGIVLAVSAERYRSFESLVEDLTRLMEERIAGAVRNIYTTAGKKITTLDEIEDGLECVCLCNKEVFKKLEYTPHPNRQPTTRLSRSIRAGSPYINSGTSTGAPNGTNGTSNGSPAAGAAGSAPHTNGASPITTTAATTNSTINEAARCVHPRIVTLIRNGTKPRRVLRLLLNRRNSPSFDHVLTAITQCVKLDSGCVRKVFTASGQPVQQLADFFGCGAVFFAYGTERVQPDDFKLEPDEQRAVAGQTRRGPAARSSGAAAGGVKPRMPVKNSVNLHNKTYDAGEVEAALLAAGIPVLPDADETAAAAGSCAASLAGDADSVGGGSVDGGLGMRPFDARDLPERICAEYTIGPIVGDGNFAMVLRVHERRTGRPFALKIIDKSKCKGKEHYIDAEVRVMKKLRHPHIMEMMFDADTPKYMFLVLEYVSGGDLFDAITTATRFTESQARIMMRHLASAMAYLHALGIVHRDIKPENLLVELDADGQVVELKLADFGLACEVVQPLLAVCGTPTYVAPEILLETGYALKIDVWAAGIILYILLCGFPPFVSPDNQQEPLFDAILSGVYEFPEPYWTGIGDDVRDLIANMLQSDPDLRFSSEDVLDHVWTIGGGEAVEGDGTRCDSRGSLVDFS